MKTRGYGYWIGSALVLALACLAALTIKNEYYFYAAYVVIQRSPAPRNSPPKVGRSK